jgi:hypothetical protein
MNTIFDPLEFIVDPLPAGPEEIHCFEAVGLGKAPFRFVAVTERRGSSCDYCGHDIRWECWVSDAEGRTFKVGNECIKKSGDEGLIERATLERRRIDREKRRAKALEKQKAEAEKQAAIREAKRAAMAKREAIVLTLRKELFQIHEWLIVELEKKTMSGLAMDFTERLACEFRTLASYSEKQLAWLRHFYAQGFGRANSKAYKAAEDRFDGLMEASREPVEKLAQQFRQIAA